MALAGCAGPAGGPPPLDGSMDGVYVGTRIADASCGGGGGGVSQGIRFVVSGRHIEVPSRHVRRRLNGTVAADGRITLSDPAGQRAITGSLGGGRLSASETVAETGGTKHNRSLVDPTVQPCLWRFEAARVPQAAAGADVGDGS